MVNRYMGRCLALASMATAWPALAQTNVTMYGHLNTAVERITRDGATNGSVVAAPSASASRLSNYGSFFGVRGTEDLGGGLKALFQIESYVFVDGVSPPGFSGWAARNGRVGLEGAWGTVFGGVWDTPMRLVLTRDPFGGTLFDGGQMLGNGVANTVNNTQASSSFARRQVNTVAYWSPRWNGVQGQVHYSFGEDAANGVKPNLVSTALNYAQGPLALSLAYESHQRFGGEGTHDRALLAYAGYTVGNTNIGGFYMDQRYQRALPTASGELKGRVWQLHAIHRLGNTALKASYTRASDGTGSLTALSTNGSGQSVIAADRMIGQLTAGEGTGADQWVLGVEHSLSKRSSVHATFLLHRNERNGSFTPAGAPPSPAGAVGVDTRALALGIRHLF